MTNPRQPVSGSLDRLVGSNIRAQRLSLHMSQETLALSLGISFQQIQKYEKGTNRVSASRLYEMSRILHTSLAYFFETDVSI